MIQGYLLNRKQRTKIGSSYSTWENIISGVPQGSILGPLLFNIFLCDLFLEHENCCYVNYADDTTPYIVANNTAEVLEKLTNLTQRLFTWFAKNKMKANHGKYHLLLSTQEDGNIQISNTTINYSISQILLGLVFDNKLTFDKHIEDIRQKAKIILSQYTTITFMHCYWNVQSGQWHLSGDNEWSFSAKGTDTSSEKYYTISSWSNPYRF